MKFEDMKIEELEKDVFLAEELKVRLSNMSDSIANYDIVLDRDINSIKMNILSLMQKYDIGTRSISNEFDHSQGEYIRVSNEFVGKFLKSMGDKRLMANGIGGNGGSSSSAVKDGKKNVETVIKIIERTSGTVDGGTLKNAIQEASKHTSFPEKSSRSGRPISSEIGKGMNISKHEKLIAQDFKEIYKNLKGIKDAVGKNYTIMIPRNSSFERLMVSTALFQKVYGTSTASGLGNVFNSLHVEENERLTTAKCKLSLCNPSRVAKTTSSSVLSTLKDVFPGLPKNVKYASLGSANSKYVKCWYSGEDNELHLTTVKHTDVIKKYQKINSIEGKAYEEVDYNDLVALVKSIDNCDIYGYGHYRDCMDIYGDTIKGVDILTKKHPAVSKLKSTTIDTVKLLNNNVPKDVYSLTSEVNDLLLEILVEVETEDTKDDPIPDHKERSKAGQAFKLARRAYSIYRLFN